MMTADVHGTSGWLRRGALTPLVMALLLALLVAGCASRSFSRGGTAARAGDWDTAVEHYRRAVQEKPNNSEYQIALERAMLSASLQHLDQARILEARGQLDDALREYRRASEFDPPNRQLAGKVVELERRIRDQIEAARPPASMQQLRQAAQQSGPPPLFSLNTELPGLRFNNASLRDILNAMGMAVGINVTYERDFQDRAYSVSLEGVTFGEALTQVLTANQLFYKVMNARTIMVIPDNTQKRQQYEDIVVRVFYISHGDAAELANLLNTVIRIGAAGTTTMVVPNKTSNTITVRGTAAVVGVAEKIIDANDNPRAEVVVDVQILEVNRNRAKQFGLDLGNYAVTAAFSPETDPRGTGDTGGSIASQPFNANTVSRGISTADFYLAVPTAVIRFLESDSETKLIAKPQLRGAEGQKLTLNLGDDIPVPSTTFTPIAQGGANFNPLTSFSYRSVGVTVELTPRVTFEGDVVMDLLVESSNLGRDINIAGQNLPSFGSRKVTTRLRLREGESSLLAGLLREDERRSLTGFPGLLRLPIIRQLFSNNDSTIAQTDIVMLLTPRIVRTHELTPQDVAPIYIGTTQNLGLGTAPPLIAPGPAVDALPAGATVPSPALPGAPPPGVPPAPGTPVGPPGVGGVNVVPQGSSPIPGTTNVPAPAAPQTATPPPVTAAEPAPPSSAAAAPTAAQPTSSTAPASAGQILVSPPGSEFRVSGGPYTVPISVNGASRLSSVSLTLTFNPAVLRVRAVNEGSFMRSGGVAAAFTNQVDAAAGRIDIAIIRPGDVTGVAGTGLLAAVLFDAIGAGPANLSVTGTAAAPGGAALGLQFAPASPVTVR